MFRTVARLKRTGRSGLPPYVAVPNLRGGTDNLFHYATYLGKSANPFITEADPNLPGFKVRNLALPPDIPAARLEDRQPPGAGGGELT